MKMAEADLLPAVRDAGEDTLIVADGTSCRHQVDLGTGRKALHVAQVIDMVLGNAVMPPADSSSDSAHHRCQHP
ncbi:MAG: hypothetical protein F4206_12790 [Gammaproteobacteria bacterium]|nr:hypothetical protein [Gammaproteobacteria bacterium]MYG67585.1 hypothetical protein [Gammaproteobacteria bacterium]